MGQRLLANQFIVRLRLQLKSRTVGSEENLEQLFVKVKFEEAKVRELSKLCNVSPGHPRRVPSSNKRGPKDSTQPDVHHTPGSPKEQDRPGRPVTTPLSNCGFEGYFARDCPYTRRRLSPRMKLKDSAIKPWLLWSLKNRFFHSRRRWHNSGELAAAVTDATGTITTTKTLYPVQSKGTPSGQKHQSSTQQTSQEGLCTITAIPRRLN